MPQYIKARCECCHLMHSVKDRIGTIYQDKECATCRLHQGDHYKLKRAEEHETMLREHLTAADRFARQTDEANQELKARIASALRSRDRAIKILQSINDLHTFRPNGVCACGIKKGCRTASAVSGRWVQEMIRRADEEDERPARRPAELTRLREELAILDSDNDFEWVEGLDPNPLPSTASQDTA